MTLLEDVRVRGALYGTLLVVSAVMYFVLAEGSLRTLARVGVIFGISLLLAEGVIGVWKWWNSP